MTELKTLLRELSPGLREGEYVFCSFPGARYGDLAYFRPLASVSESEGLTLVIERGVAERAGLAFDGVFRHIVLGVPSGLEDVGLSATVCTELAREGISVNLIAGRFHDHLLVPAARAEQAVDALRRLTREARGEPGA